LGALLALIDPGSGELNQYRSMRIQNTGFNVSFKTVSTRNFFQIKLAHHFADYGGEAEDDVQ